MKKLGVFALVLFMTTFVFNQSFANAQNGDEQNNASNYMKTSGIIKEIVSNDGTVTLTVESEEKDPQMTILTVTKDALIFNSRTTKVFQEKSFQKGQRIDAYYDKNKPMILIYPTQITPELIIVHDEEQANFVKVSKFDKQYVSLDNELKLNIGKETILENEKGIKVDQRYLDGKELVVFYTITTRSIPAQTTPSKIVAIDYSLDEKEKIDTTNFVKSTGVIKDIVKTKDMVTLTVETEEKDPQITFFKLKDDTLIFNSGTTKQMKKETFQKGQRIDAYYDKKKPMILIYPAQITPDLVIVHDKEKASSVKVSKFDNQYVSLDNELKLNIGKETILENEKGKKIKREDLARKELVVFYTISTFSIPAQTTPSKIVAIDYSLEEKEKIDTTNFMKSSGVIKDIVKTKDMVTLTVETEDKEPQITFFKLKNDTLLFNSGIATKKMKKESFKKGQRIDAYYDKNKPMLLIYPAQITPEIVIVHENKKLGFVKVSKFDKEFVSLDKELKLNISKQTILENEKGKKIKREDLAGKELVVFYTITTRSIPAITTPSKIVAINYLSPEMKEVRHIFEKDHFMLNGTKMIPLQKVAEHLGYVVNYNSKNKTIYLTLGNSSFSITSDEKTYSYNKSLRQFAEKPVLKNNNMYVSEDILELLK